MADDNEGMVYSHEFTLTVEAVYDIPLKAVRNFRKHNEYEQIQEGGLNDYVHLRRKPISQPFTIEVERYVTAAFSDPLSNGTELTLPVILTVKQFSDGGSSTGKIFIFTGVIVQGVSYGDLDAERSGLMTETVTLAYNNMYAASNLLDLSSFY